MAQQTVTKELTQKTAASEDTPPPPLLDLVQLCLTRSVGGRYLDRLIDHFGSLRAALDAPPKELEQVPGIGAERARAIHESNKDLATEELARAEALGVEILGLGHPRYPRLLNDLYSPPLLLYARGELDLNTCSVAVVGSRRASAYGRRMAREISRGLAQVGITIVSGLARGVDAEAHRGALEAGGTTVAVLGCGIDQCYPREHRDLLEACVDRGAVLSEFPLGSPPAASHFPRRNRIVSGLSHAVCVMEATARSGSLITASWALEQGRDVFALPHRVGDPGAEGVLRLLREGATPLCSTDDVLTALGLRAATQSWITSDETATAVPPAHLSAAARAVFERLGTELEPIDNLIESLGESPAKVFGALLELESRGLVQAGPRRTYSRRPQTLWERLRSSATSNELADNHPCTSDNIDTTGTSEGV